MYRRAHKGQERELGPDHPNTLTSVNNLANVLESQGRYKEAEELYRRASEGRESVLGPDHPDTICSVSSLADILKKQQCTMELEEFDKNQDVIAIYKGVCRK